MPRVIKLLTWDKYLDDLLYFIMEHYGKYHTLTISKHIKNTDFYVVEITIYE